MSAQSASPVKSSAIKVARRAAQAKPESVLSISKSIAQYSASATIKHSLGAGDTAAFPPPEYFAESFVNAIREKKPGLTPIAGDVGIREALAPRFSKLLGTPVEKENILLTAGTQHALFVTLSTIVDPGDIVMVADPEFLCIVPTLRFLGAEVRYIPFTRLGDDAALDLDALRKGFEDGAKGLVFSHPHNPTGAMMSSETLRELAEVIVEADGWAVVDELYARFVFDDRSLDHLAAQPGMSERCVTALGVAKTEHATAYRISAVVAPADLMPEIAEMVEITTVRAPAYSQYALQEWMADDEEFVRERMVQNRQLRDIAVERLSKVDGISFSVPSATMWLWIDVTGLGRTEEEVVKAIIDSGIAVQPGSKFGPAGAGFFRLSFTQDPATWPTVVETLAHTLEAIKA